MSVGTNNARDSVNGYLVIGAGLYWTSTLTQLLPKGNGQNAVEATAYDSSLTTYVLFIFIAIFVSAATFFHKHFQTEKIQCGLAVCAFVAGMASLAFSFLPTFPGTPLSPLNLFCTALRAIETTGLMLLWGLAFASLDKQTAGQNVILTLLCTMFLYYCLLSIHSQIPQFKHIAYLASAIILLSGRVSFASKNRRSVASQRQSIIGFYASRATFGFFSGLTGSLMALVVVKQVDTLIIVGMAIIIGLLFACFFLKDSLYTALPVFPLIAVGLIFLPFLSGGMEAASGIASPMIWATWILLTSFQLSDLKERYGMSEVKVCFSEKAALTIAWVIGMTVGRAMMHMPLSNTNGEQAIIHASVIIAYTAVLFAIYSIFRLVYTRKEAELRDEMALSEDKRMERVYDAIGEEYKLSTRERQVMEMLAQGYTRTYIKNKLVISEGTTRAHIAHVYQKLDVHKKDELLQLIKNKTK